MTAIFRAFRDYFQGAIFSLDLNVFFLLQYQHMLWFSGNFSTFYLKDLTTRWRSLSSNIGFTGRALIRRMFKIACV